MPRFTSFAAGIQHVVDLGVGRTLELSWNEAIPEENVSNTIKYLIYKASNRINVFSQGPDYIATSTLIKLTGLDNNDIYYFAVRAIEQDEDDYDVEELTQIGLHLYEYPTTELATDLGTSDLIIPVDSVEGFPLQGFITIGSEAMQYSAIQVTPYPAFIISSTADRGAKDTTAITHNFDDSVSLYTGYPDNNLVIQRGVPTINYPNNCNLIDDGYDGYCDGYARTTEDFVTTDYSAAEDNVNFPPFDYCGYHRTNLEDYFKGELCGSYAGGEYNGQRGLNLYERSLARLEVQLEQTGEQTVLLQRKWEGERCPCMDSRREHQRARCPICYGTGFVDGYDIYFYPRNPPTGRILVRYSPNEEDLII